MKISKGDPSSGQEGLSQEVKEQIDIDIARCGLYTDAGSSFLFLLPTYRTKLEDISHIQTYGEYFHDKTYGDYVMSESDATLVEEWNSKISAFNNDLERIKRENDEKKVKDFYDEMMAFLR